jgi:hypothetical protein
MHLELGGGQRGLASPRLLTASFSLGMHGQTLVEFDGEGTIGLDNLCPRRVCGCDYRIDPSRACPIKKMGRTSLVTVPWLTPVWPRPRGRNALHIPHCWADSVASSVVVIHWLSHIMLRVWTACRVIFAPIFSSANAKHFNVDPTAPCHCKSREYRAACSCFLCVFGLSSVWLATHRRTSPVIISKTSHFQGSITFIPRRSLIVLHPCTFLGMWHRISTTSVLRDLRCQGPKPPHSSSSICAFIQPQLFDQSCLVVCSPPS